MVLVGWNARDGPVIRGVCDLLKKVTGVRTSLSSSVREGFSLGPRGQEEGMDRGPGWGQVELWVPPPGVSGNNPRREAPKDSKKARLRLLGAAPEATPSPTACNLLLV